MPNCPYLPDVLPRGRERPRADEHCWLDHGLRKEYGPQVTCEVWWTLLVGQGRKCGACRRAWRGRVVNGRRTGERHFDTDHDHATGRLRGLLCHSCNQLLNYGVEEEIIRRGELAGAFTLSGGDRVTRGLIRYIHHPPAEHLGITALVTDPAKLTNAGRVAPRVGLTPRSEPDTGLERRRAAILQRRQEAEAEASWREILALARRVLEASWDADHRGVRGWWLRQTRGEDVLRRERDRWVEERLVRAGLKLPARERPAGARPRVAMPSYLPPAQDRSARHPRSTA